MPAQINTRKVTDRRQLSFARLEDILADVNRLDSGERRATGNWTPAQIVDHVASIMEGALDGIDAKVGLPMRIMGRLMKKRALGQTFRAGYTLPANMKGMLPDPAVSWADAVGRLHRVMDRVKAGDRMTQPSPFLGPMSHEDWVNLHCRHAELHLSFIHPV